MPCLPEMALRDLTGNWAIPLSSMIIPVHSRHHNESRNTQPQPFLRRPPPQNILSLGIRHHVPLTPGLADGFGGQADFDGKDALAALMASAAGGASGLPVGGDLEYADEVTLGRAFEGRRRLST